MGSARRQHVLLAVGRGDHAARRLFYFVFVAPLTAIHQPVARVRFSPARSDHLGQPSTTVASLPPVVPQARRRVVSRQPGAAAADATGAMLMRAGGLRVRAPWRHLVREIPTSVVLPGALFFPSRGLLMLMSAGA